jgi:hypothetical protein
MNDTDNPGSNPPAGNVATADARTDAHVPATEDQIARATQDNPRTHSPARDARERQSPGEPTERTIKLANGEYSEKVLNDAVAFKAEQDVRTATLPKDANGYEIKLPAEFKAPAGVDFKFDMNDPLLAEARNVAAARKLDQDTFSTMLGVYAANKIREFQNVSAARNAELAKLGATGPGRIDTVANWLQAKVGGKAGTMIATLKKYPVASNVEALEGLMSVFSTKGGTTFDQRVREAQKEPGKITGYETMSFEQRRFAQDQQMAASPHRRR